MTVKANLRPVDREIPVSPAPRLPLPAAISPGQTALARRPVVATHAAGTTAHARQHAPRQAQS